jgi:hypothetical protein
VDKPAGVDGALRLGKRGLHGGSSLAKLLAGETKTPEDEASGAAVRRVQDSGGRPLTRPVYPPVPGPELQVVEYRGSDALPVN